MYSSGLHNIPLVPSLPIHPHSPFWQCGVEEEGEEGEEEDVIKRAPLYLHSNNPHSNLRRAICSLLAVLMPQLPIRVTDFDTLQVFLGHHLMKNTRYRFSGASQ